MSTTSRRPATLAKGFTLIELLVILCIIALLAAILFPVFAHARENARKSSCMNNLKQMGIGFAQYTKDYSSFPLAVVGGTKVTKSGGGVPAGWADALEIYTKSR